MADDPTPTPEGTPPANQPTGSAISNPPEQSFQERVPEKFQVWDGEGDDRAFNLEGSAAKMLESYTALEKSRGGPESPGDYKIDAEAFGEGFNVDEFMADEGTKGFFKAHAL